MFSCGDKYQKDAPCTSAALCNADTFMITENTDMIVIKSCRYRFFSTFYCLENTGHYKVKFTRISSPCDSVNLCNKSPEDVNKF
jgi:hypothetical protein